MNIPLFVYGTLRPNHRLWDLVEKDCLSHKPAELHGARLYVPEGFWFPVAVQTDNHDDVIYGDLLLMKDAQQVREVIKMEMQAGYQLRAAYVWVDEVMVRASCFIYPKVPDGSTHIISGDWSEWEQQDIHL